MKKPICTLCKQIDHDCQFLLEHIIDIKTYICYECLIESTKEIYYEQFKF